LGSVYGLDFFGCKSNEIGGLLNVFVKSTSNLRQNNKKAADPDEDKSSNSKNSEPKNSEPHSSSESSSGAKCGSSGQSTPHWYCEGIHHYCKQGEG